MNKPANLLPKQAARLLAAEDRNVRQWGTIYLWLRRSRTIKLTAFGHIWSLAYVKPVGRWPTVAINVTSNANWTSVAINETVRFLREQREGAVELSAHYIKYPICSRTLYDNYQNLSDELRLAIDILNRTAP